MVDAFRIPNEVVAISTTFSVVLHLRWENPRKYRSYELYIGRYAELQPSWLCDPADNLTRMHQRLEIVTFTRAFSPAINLTFTREAPDELTDEFDSTIEILTTKGELLIPTWREILYGHYLQGRAPLWRSAPLRLLDPEREDWFLWPRIPRVTLG